MLLKWSLILFMLLSFSCGGRLPVGQSLATYQAAVLSPTQDSLLILDLLTHRPQYRFRTGEMPQDLALGNGWVFVSHLREPSIMILQRQDARTWYRVGKVGVPFTPGRLAWNAPFSELCVTAFERPLLFVYRMQGQRRPLLQQSLRLPDELGQPTALALSQDGQKLYLAGSHVQVLQRQDERWELASKLELPEHTHVSDMTWTEDSLFLSDQYHDQLLRYRLDQEHWDEPIDLAAELQTDGEELSSAVLPARLALNHAGTKLYITGSGASVLLVVDVAAGKLLQTLDLAAYEPPAAVPLGVAVAADDQRVYLTAQSGRNLVILESSPDIAEPERIIASIGTTASEALLPPLGEIRIF